MFSTLGKIVNRTWLILLVGWVGLAIALRFAAPDWNEVAKDGQFSFLPDDSPSRRADDLFNRGFPHDLLSSSVVIVLNRESDEGIGDDDRKFITDVLKPRLRRIAGLREDAKEGDKEKKEAESETPLPTDDQVIARIRAFDDEGVGSLVLSADQKATLVILELTNDFYSRRNRPAIDAVEGLLDKLRKKDLAPSGLDFYVTGSALVGRDISRANEDSAKAIGRWTIVLVVTLTLVVFRAPLLALIPLVTLFFAMDVALKTLSLLAQADVIGLFKGIEAYSTVVVYASGVDYSLFLISRFQEEMESGTDRHAAIRDAVGKVGAAIAASALTEIAGIGMMSFARFGKFHQAGIAISFSLFVMMLAVLTLTPALLRVAGPLAFWPYHRHPAHRATPPATHANQFEALWERIANAILRRPGTFWLITTATMVPFAVVGVLWYNHLNYDLVGNLPRHAASAQGTQVLEQHFPAGATGPVNLLVENDQVDFRDPDGLQAIEALTKNLNERRDDLQISDVRSLSAPLGGEGTGSLTKNAGAGRKFFTAGVVRRRALDYFVSSNEELHNHVTRLEVELNLDPFSTQAMDVLDQLEATAGGLLPSELQSGSRLYFSGSTASLRDLRSVGARDRTLINVLVVASVFVILVILLRRVVLTVYLLLTVLFSYLVTLGATFGFFYLANRQDFPGLDWTVPLFLFTVLIAIGEDYNILLVTRIHEEEERHGPEKGVAVALAKTGPIISSCGFIMAGTFLSLAIAGQLAMMIQLGFALAFGVLLDTFVVRPILVPTYMLLTHRWRSGFSRQAAVPEPTLSGSSPTR